MKKVLIGSLFAIAFSGFQQIAKAQAPGSASVYGGSALVKSIISGGISSDVSESLYIGPGIHEIDGTWEIYAQRVIIDPMAVISGSGSIQIYNPGDLLSIYPAAVSMPTAIDGNAGAIANSINVNIRHFNNAGIVLSEMGFPADLILDGWMNNIDASTLYVGSDLSLEVDGADITLGTGVVGDLRFDADAGITNYRPERMVIVNNDILSHMVKENFTGAFTFPVGITDGDYTPVTLTNISAITVNVGVQDYTASIAEEQTADPGPDGIPADGMDRTWHIFADVPGSGTTVALQHNTVTNQSGFTDANHFVTRWSGTVPNTSGDNTVSFSTSAWQSNALSAGVAGTMINPAGTLAGSTVRSRHYSSLSVSSVAEESYFTKSSDPLHPLPVNLISFNSSGHNCDILLDWETGVEAGISSYRLTHSVDGSKFTVISNIAAKGNNSKYSFAHKAPEKGVHLYRLEMIEADGSYTVSPVEKAEINCDRLTAGSALVIYPNPTAGKVTVDGMGGNVSSTVRLLNLHGQIVQEIITQNSKETIDVSALPSASYLLQVVQSNEVKVNVKLVKQ